jgi:hypothetical protein
MRRALNAADIAAAVDPDVVDRGPLQALHVPRPVDRYDYVREKCRGLRVLDLGAYDETEVEQRQDESWRWLHAEIAGVARETLGVDSSPKIQDSGGIDTEVGTRIVHGRVEDLEPIVREFQPDLVVAGELIEHTNDTIGWLGSLAKASPGTRVLATTPNTTSIINLVLAFLRRENAHPDHIQVYSFRTLATLAGRVPLRDVTITPYYYDPHLFVGKVPAAAKPVVAVVGRLLRVVQWLFPLTSFGLILEGTLGDGPPES